MRFVVFISTGHINDAVLFMLFVIIRVIELISFVFLRI